MDLDRVILEKGKEWKVHPILLKAFVMVESGGSSFGPDGKLLIRFEPQWFVHLAKRFGEFFYIPGTTTQQLAAQAFRPDVNSPWQLIHIGDNPATKNVHEGQEQEWKVFNFAYKLNPNAAVQSISMGFCQCMGFNFKVCGYATPELMFESFQVSKDEQIAAWLRFIPGYKNGALLQALREGDEKKAIEYYNGNSQIAWYLNALTIWKKQIQASGFATGFKF